MAARMAEHRGWTIRVTLRQYDDDRAVPSTRRTNTEDEITAGGLTVAHRYIELAMIEQFD